MKKHAKLVRDNIPDIMIRNGSKPIMIPLTDDKMFNQCLGTKLLEETLEYCNGGEETEELIDIFTVIINILKIKGISFDEFMKLYCKKLEEKGGFEKRIYLIGEEDGEQ